MSKELVYLGDFSATPPEHSRHMECYDCGVTWTGCWDNFQCPKCGEGELPSSEINKCCCWAFDHPPCPLHGEATPYKPFERKS